MGNRAPLFAGIGLVGAGAIAFAVLAANADSDREPAPGPPTSERSAADDPPVASAPSSPHDADAEALVETLAQAGTARARRDLVELYAKWGGDPTKDWARRAIVDALVAGQSPKRAIETLLGAIDKDRELAGGIDPTFEYTAQKLVPFWEVPEMFEYGRDRMLAARTDKSRALLARSLCDSVRTQGTQFVDPGGQRAAWLTADLVDAHNVTRDTWAQEQIREGVRTTMGDDVAEVLADPLGTSVSDLEGLKARLNGIRAGSQAVDEGIAETPEGAEILPRLHELDDEELADAVGRGVENPHHNRNHGNR